MKRLIITFACVMVFTLQTSAMAKGQWIYPYAHPAVVASLSQSEC